MFKSHSESNGMMNAFVTMTTHKVKSNNNYVTLCIYIFMICNNIVGISIQNMFHLITGRLKYLTLTDPTKVWMPDTFFRNEKEGRFHNILVPNVYIRIFPDGFVLYSIRLEASFGNNLRNKIF